MSFIEKQIVKNIKAGEVIFHEDDPGSSMFIIQSGKVEVSTINKKQKVVLAILGKGSIFGEMSLVDNRPRSATVTALTEVTCLEINRLLFDKKLEETPLWMQSFYAILVERLREANKKQNTLTPEDVAKQIVFLLSILLANETPDNHDRVSIPWQDSAETIAFLLNTPIEQVVKVMNKLSLTPLARGEINYEKGRLFTTDDLKEFNNFSEFCKEKFLVRWGKEISPEFEERSPKELQILKFIDKLMNEQATASDLNIKYFEERCKSDLKKSLDEFSHELKTLVRKGILVKRLDANEDKYYEVDRELLNLKLGLGKTREMFEKIERKLA